IVRLDKQQSETARARDAAAAQLAGLKETREAALTVLKWEKELQGIADPKELAERFTSTRKALAAAQEKRKAAEPAYQAALRVVTEARVTLDGIKDPLLRAAEEQGQHERLQLRAELRKEAGLEAAAKDPAAPPPPADPKKTAP